MSTSQNDLTALRARVKHSLHQEHVELGALQGLAPRDFPTLRDFYEAVEEQEEPEEE